MSKRLIYEEDAIDAMKDMYHAAEKWGAEATDDIIKARAESCMATLVEMKLRTEKLPSAQPEVIRCKDCENLQTDWKPLLPDRHYCGVMDSMMKEDDFCSYAERRQNG